MAPTDTALVRDLARHPFLSRVVIVGFVHSLPDCVRALLPSHQQHPEGEMASVQLTCGLILLKEAQACSAFTGLVWL